MHNALVALFLVPALAADTEWPNFNFFRVGPSSGEATDLEIDAVAKRSSSEETKQSTDVAAEQSTGEALSTLTITVSKQSTREAAQVRKAHVAAQSMIRVDRSFRQDAAANESNDVAANLSEGEALVAKWTAYKNLKRVKQSLAAAANHSNAKQSFAEAAKLRLSEKETRALQEQILYGLVTDRIEKQKKIRPNILFLMSDSMDGRVVDKNSAEAKAVKMPFLRGFLAKNGANFVKSYSNNPMCVPARSSMMTGRSSDKIHVWGNSQGLAASPGGVLDDTCVKRNGKKRCKEWAKAQDVNETILSAMQKLGYQVHVQGRTHFGGGLLNRENHEFSVEGRPTMEAFDDVRTGEVIRSADIHKPMAAQSIFLENAKEHAQDSFFGGADWIAMDKCGQFIDELPAPQHLKQPFFLHCSLNLPHFSFLTNSTWLKMVNEKKVKVPTWIPNFPNDYHPYDVFMSTAKNVADAEFKTEDILKLRKIYFAMVGEADTILEGIWKSLEQKGYGLNNTYVIYVSDHGEMKFEHRQMYKASLYEGSARVPLQIAGPGITKGLHVDTHVTSLLDVFPTLLDMAQEEDWEAHSQLQGMSVLEAAGGTSVAPDNMKLTAGKDNRDFVLAQYNWVEANTGAFMVRTGPWKCIFYGKTYQAYKNYPPQLFNVNTDPEELHNVADEHPAVIEELDTRLREVLDPDEVDRKVMEHDFEHLKDLSCKWGHTCQELSEDVLKLVPIEGHDLFNSWYSEAANLFHGPVLKAVKPVHNLRG